MTVAFQNSEAFAKLFDHTLLRANCVKSEIQTLCQEAMTHGFYSVCVPPNQIPLVVKVLKNSAVLPITVVGFPLGYQQTQVKVTETKLAIDQGAREIDMVMSIDDFLSGEDQKVADDIAAVVAASGAIPVKVIVETAYLNESLIRKSVKICADAQAAFIKTSTGFASRGASLEDIKIMFDEIKKLKSPMQIKASGGIKTVQQVQELHNAGASRIGSSNSVAILASLEIDTIPI